MIHMILEHILQFTSHYVFSLWGHLVENIVCRCGAAGLPECFGCSWKSRRGWIDCPSSRHRLQCFIYIRCSSPSRGTGKESLATMAHLSSWIIGSLDEVKIRSLDSFASTFKNSWFRWGFWMVAMNYIDLAVSIFAAEWNDETKPRDVKKDVKTLKSRRLWLILIAVALCCTISIHSSPGVASMVELTLSRVLTLPVPPILFRLLRMGKLARAFRMVSCH